MKLLRAMEVVKVPPEFSEVAQCTGENRIMNSQRLTADLDDLFVQGTSLVEPRASDQEGGKVSQCRGVVRVHFAKAVTVYEQRTSIQLLGELVVPSPVSQGCQCIQPNSEVGMEFATGRHPNSEDVLE